MEPHTFGCGALCLVLPSPEIDRSAKIRHSRLRKANAAGSSCSGSLYTSLSTKPGQDHILNLDPNSTKLYVCFGSQADSRSKALWWLLTNCITESSPSGCAQPQCRLKIRPCNTMGHSVTFFRLPRLWLVAKLFLYQNLTKSLCLLGMDKNVTVL